MAIVDAEFYNTLSKFSWSLNGHGYVKTKIQCEHLITKSGGSMVSMHQVVQLLALGLENVVCVCDNTYVELGLSIDHINNNKLDNRAYNLRYVSMAFNNSKKGGKLINHSSKYKGVCWNKAKSKWHAQYRLNGKTKHIGYFNCEEDAARARDAVIRAKGLDYVLNSPSSE